MHILLTLEIIGTIAFAVSGAIVGIQKRMDIFGVSILGLTTAVGGGILRDLILNITPPAAFRTPVFAITAIAVSILVFIRPIHASVERKGSVYEKLLQVMDSIGLGLFTVIGVQVAKVSSVETNFFLETFVGVLTGVGGGLMRDVFAGNNVDLREALLCLRLDHRRLALRIALDARREQRFDGHRSGGDRDPAPAGGALSLEPSQGALTREALKDPGSFDILNGSWSAHEDD